jgi:hypothetical protein
LNGNIEEGSLSSVLFKFLEYNLQVMPIAIELTGDLNLIETNGGI